MDQKETIASQIQLSLTKLPRGGGAITVNITGLTAQEIGNVATIASRYISDCGYKINHVATTYDIVHQQLFVFFVEQVG